MDYESTYVDARCWPELKHSAGLGFRNAGQDPISTDRKEFNVKNFEREFGPQGTTQY
ncbi:hypothetical protein RhiirA5_428245 [Rhizophagus irregularis]|uniref:Uncharacterized protein n=2 Tax=Rhizophagus irregularis TaxID=588596 RepID=A0A2N0P0Q5_9GLOM|nr:hypothetical protein RhiirA5_428245 [Rhizophagus irregularis]